MPIYSFLCATCGIVRDEVRSVEDRRRSTQCECGGTRRRVPERFRVDTFEPYYDEGLGADVGSRREKKALMKELGVVEAGDRVGGARNWDEKAPHVAEKVPPRGIGRRGAQTQAQPRRRDPVVQTHDEEGRVVESQRFSELKEW